MPLDDTGIYEQSQRPWGRYEVVSKTKLIYVNPLEKLSLQYHNHRDEHWRIIQGNGMVILDGMQIYAQEGSEFYIPKKTEHRIIAGKDGITFLEVATGLVDEGDIVRIDDEYGRS